jgi:hypothetical protein
MFSRLELSQHVIPPGSPDDMPLMEIAEFHAHQLRNPTDNQRIVAHCGSKDDFSSALEFWLWSIHLISGATAGEAAFRFAPQEAHCEPISNRECFEIVDYYAGCLKRPPDFLFRQDLMAAMKMLSDVATGEARTSVLAEFEDVYIAIHDIILL